MHSTNLNYSFPVYFFNFKLSYFTKKTMMTICAVHNFCTRNKLNLVLLFYKEFKLISFNPDYAKVIGLPVKFLEFLIEAFTNRKYVYLNSTRMVNQGDIRSLYNISCKVTKSF